MAIPQRSFFVLAGSFFFSKSSSNSFSGREDTPNLNYKKSKNRRNKRSKELVGPNKEEPINYPSQYQTPPQVYYNSGNTPIPLHHFPCVSYTSYNFNYLTGSPYLPHASFPHWNNDYSHFYSPHNLPLPLSQPSLPLSQFNPSQFLVTANINDLTTLAVDSTNQ